MTTKPTSECEFDPDHLYHEHREGDALRVEVDRLQRLLRRIAQLTGHVPPVEGESNVEHAQRCPRCLAVCEKNDELRAEVERWEAIDTQRGAVVDNLSNSQGKRIHQLEAEVEQQTRLANVAAERMRTAEYREDLLKQDVERLRGVIDEIAAEDDE